MVHQSSLSKVEGGLSPPLGATPASERESSLKLIFRRTQLFSLFSPNRVDEQCERVTLLGPETER